jgi:hypothetical protein
MQMNTKTDAIAEDRIKISAYRRKILKPKSTGIPILIFIAFLILENPFISCTNVHSQFFDKVLNDFDTNSYFIALDLKSPYYKGRVIIENNDLFTFLQKTKGFDKEKYKTFMNRILTHHKVLRIKEKDIGASKFIKVDLIESVLNIAGRGKNNFVAYYFNGIVLNIAVTDKEQAAIINQLFYWKFPAKIDSITGALIIG